MTAEDHTNTPPRLDPKAEQKILRQLERAAKLAEKRKISNMHHAAIGVDAVMRLWGDAGRGVEYSIRGRRFNRIAIPSRGWATLLERTGLSPEEAFERYGRFTGFVATLLDHQRRSNDSARAELGWDEEMEAILDEGLLRLRLVNRMMFAAEDRLKKQKRFFPQLSSLIRTGSVAAVAAVIGGLVTGTCS